MSGIIQNDFIEFENSPLIKQLQDYIKTKQEENKQKVNIFRILRLDNHEIRHSNFLAWLLNPKETHCLNSLFIDKFLKTALSDFACENYSNIQIKLEYQIDDNGRIDILLFNDEFVCVIENKYGSKEHDEQCKRYKKFITEKSQFKDKRDKYFIFLDLKEPEEELLKDCLKGYMPITYEQIKDILEDILTSKQNITHPVYEVIEQYVAILREKYPMTDNETLIKSKEIYKAYKDVIETVYSNCNDKNIIQKTTKIALETIFNENNDDIQHLHKDKNIITFLPTGITNIEALKFGDWSDNDDYIIAIAISNFKWHDEVTLEILISPTKDKQKANEDRRQDLIDKCRGFEFNKSQWTSYKYTLLSKEEWLDCKNTREIEAKILTHWQEFPLQKLKEALNSFCNSH